MSDEAMSDQTTSGPSNNPRGVLLRDLFLFQMKLWLDGLKDIVLSPLSIAACAVDILFRRSGQRSLFYGVMRLGERFDLWLNLYSPAMRADAHPDGLLHRDRRWGRDVGDMVDSDTQQTKLPLSSSSFSSPSQTSGNRTKPPTSTR